MRKLRIAIPEIDQNVLNYVRAVSGTGMEPVVISVQREQLHVRYQKEYMDYSQFRVEGYDGLILPGGGDISPVRYGEDNRGSIMIMEELDELQFSILEQFVNVRKPVLGICRGHQLINVFFGGSLIQNLPVCSRHAKKIDEADKVHDCCAKAGSWLEQLFGSEFRANSAHHQAAARLGSGLETDGWCPNDDVVEAFHHTQLPIIGVQWHPERTCMGYEREGMVNALPVFRYFRALCLKQEPVFRLPAEEGIMEDRMGL